MTKERQPQPEMTGAEILIRALIDEGVETIFGYPGGAVIGIYDVLFNTPQINHILVRHEQGATHMADGYARVTGKAGVVMVTSGPGATNTVTGIATAYMDAIPLVVFTGQVSSGMIGNDAFQEADIIGITRPITKHSYLVRDVMKLAKIIHEAFHIATTGKPGPVLIDLPKDILGNKAVYEKQDHIDIRGYNPTYKGHSQQILKAAKMMAEARKPLIYAGGGVNIGNASEELTALAKKTKIPVTTTLLGLGAFPETHALSLGMLGMHGTWYANKAMSECDLVIAVGARFDDRVTGKLSEFASKARVIHIDIDPASISKNVDVDIPIVGHVKEILPELLQAACQADTKDWLADIEKWKKDHPLKYNEKAQRIPPQFVIEQLGEVTKHEAIVATDVGQNQMFTAQYYRFINARSMLSSGGLGTMGYGFPAAIGAAFAKPGSTVVCVTGDGGFQMNMQELATAVYHKIPVKIILLNNGYLGMVRQWQDLFYEKRYSSTVLEPGNPDFLKAADCFGAVGIRVEKREEVKPALEKAMAITDRPVLLDFIVEREAQVFPMVPAGAALDQMIEHTESELL